MASKRFEADRNLLVIIDPQKDFHEGGSLPVTGALADSARISKLIDTKRFDNILVTLDTHQYVDIGHPIWWTNEQKEQPKPFTIITTKDIESGKWRAAIPEYQQWTSNYIKRLEENKRFQHTIWPYHCIVGTSGHEITPSINEALARWAIRNSQLVFYMWKGTNPKAEMYSAFKADVEVPGADETKLNKQVLDRIYCYNNIVICGEASSHCVTNSVADMVEYFETKRGEKPHLLLLSDCTSPVQGYDKQAAQFFKDIDKCKFLDVLTSKDLKMIDDLKR
jgi:nicotinamidase/pyrazinamidase